MFHHAHVTISSTICWSPSGRSQVTIMLSIRGITRSCLSSEKVTPLGQQLVSSNSCYQQPPAGYLQFRPAGYQLITNNWEPQRPQLYQSHPQQPQPQPQPPAAPPSWRGNVPEPRGRGHRAHRSFSGRRWTPGAQPKGSHGCLGDVNGGCLYGWLRVGLGLG